MTGHLGARISPPDWVDMVARHDPDRRCFVRADATVVTYGQARSAINGLASALQRQGVGFGSRVAVLGVDSPEYVIAVLASMRVGAIVAPLNYRLSLPEIANLVGAIEPSAFFYSGRYRDLVHEVLGSRSVDVATVTLERERESMGDVTVDELAAAGGDREMPPITSDDDVLSVLLTSGTTGTPKGVLQSQRMMKAVTMKGIVEQGFRSDDFFYSGAPLFHVAGLGYCFFALARGASTLLLPQFDAPQVLEWLQGGGLSRCMFVPSMILALLDLPAARAAPYVSLRSIMYGGAPMHPSTIREMIEVFGCELYNGFGAGTEAGGQSILRPEDHVRALHDAPQLLGSIGRAQYGVDLKVCDELGVEVPAGSIGEIWTRADTIMSGYLTPQEGGPPPITDGWYHGGDMARRDEEGYLFLAGRRDDMILRGGENIYPFEIEGVLQTHPAVSDAAVFGLPDDYWGEVVAAAIVSDGSVSDREIRAHARSSLAAYKVPDLVVFVGELPRNATGKADKLKLKATYARSSTA